MIDRLFLLTYRSAKSIPEQTLQNYQKFIITACLSLQAGCVHFMNTPSQCDLQILLLIFSPRKRAFVGLIPLDQVLQHSPTHMTAETLESITSALVYSAPANQQVFGIL